MDMKRLFILILFVANSLQSQEFSRVDQIVDAYPKYRTPEKLAAKIQKDFNSDLDKTRAAFKWLSNNISYSIRLAKSGRRSIEYQFYSEEERLAKLQAIKDKLVKDAFIRRIGVCEEYAQSLTKLCDLMGIESKVLKGNVRNSGREIGRNINTTNHAWNIVKIENRWIIIDATWASGYSMNGKWVRDFSDYYFDIPTNQIGKTHFPDDRKWQILWDVRSKLKYYQQPIYQTYFLKQGLSYPSNIQGILAAKRAGKLSLEIKGLQANDKIFVAYANEKYSKRTQLTTTKFGKQFTVNAPLANTEMYVFVNGKLATIFKVVLT